MAETGLIIWTLRESEVDQLIHNDSEGGSSAFNWWVLPICPSHSCPWAKKWTCFPCWWWSEGLVDLIHEVKTWDSIGEGSSLWNNGPKAMVKLVHMCFAGLVCGFPGAAWTFTGSPSCLCCSWIRCKAWSWRGGSPFWGFCLLFVADVVLTERISPI